MSVMGRDIKAKTVWLLCNRDQRASHFRCACSDYDAAATVTESVSEAEHFAH